MTAVTYCSPRPIPPRRPRNRTRAGMPKPKPSPPPPIDADLHAESFRPVREAHPVALVEDYVELISDPVQLGRATWRESGCTTEYISVLAGPLKKKKDSIRWIE